MKKIVKVKDIDCAVCANELEEAIKKVKGVISVSISFMAEKMTIEIDDNLYEQTVKDILKVKKKVEPDCEIIGL